MEGMIKDLLEYTRTRLGRAIPVSPHPASMDAICRIAYDEIRAAHPERLFRIDLRGDLNGSFDPDRLQQALSNLLANAVRHGGRTQPITLFAQGDAEKVTVKVKNRGRRIPADQLQVIFNPLVQITPGHTGEEGELSTGLGLGLYIAREIVTMHGGTMEAESSDRDGTVFSASLPKTPAAARAQSVR
jgi:signal transduction histidine kinase